MRTGIKQKKVDLKTARSIEVADLRVGDKIVISWHKVGKECEGIEDEDELLLCLWQSGLQRYVNRSQKVEAIEECPGKWRTHIHVNKRDCYDIRQRVWVVNG